MSSDIKRIFIEVDQVNDRNRWELDSAVENCQYLSAFGGEDFFWKVIDDARCEENLFQYIVEANQIYMSTAIMPLVTYTQIGSPELWNDMMRAAIKHDLRGKEIYNERVFKNIIWENLDKKLVDKAFKYNYLYVMNDECNGWEQVDIDKLLREQFKKR